MLWYYSPVDIGILFFDASSAQSWTNHYVIGVRLLLTVALQQIQYMSMDFDKHFQITHVFQCISACI